MQRPTPPLNTNSYRLQSCTVSSYVFWEGCLLTRSIQTVMTWTEWVFETFVNFYQLKRLSTREAFVVFNPLKPELNPICYLLALLAHHFLHVSRIRVKSLTFRRRMSYIYIYIYIYIYMEHPFLMFLDHTQRRSTVGRTPLDE